MIDSNFHSDNTVSGSVTLVTLSSSPGEDRRGVCGAPPHRRRGDAEWSHRRQAEESPDPLRLWPPVIHLNWSDIDRERIRTLILPFRCFSNASCDDCICWLLFPIVWLVWRRRLTKRAWAHCRNCAEVCYRKNEIMQGQTVVKRSNH